MHKTTTRFLDKSYWREENVRFAEPHFRVQKCARIVNRLAGGKPSVLLDVGCGPATLGELVSPDIRYHGIDIAVHRQAANLLEMDISNNPIRFGNESFDIVVAAGFFEYMGDKQETKLQEIRSILKPGGKFVVTFTNFGHLHGIIDYYPYNNVQSVADFRRALERYFRVEKAFPSSHNWLGTEPRRKWLKAVQLNINLNIPIVSALLAVNYFFICS